MMVIMENYRTAVKKLSGTTFGEVNKRAKSVYQKIRSRSRRTPYVRSAYFQSQKIFLTVFWTHLYAKQSWTDRIRRLRFYPCALDLIRYNRITPITKQDPNQTNYLLHRFIGITSQGETFYVQIKENKRTNRKDLISIFPE